MCKFHLHACSHPLIHKTANKSQKTATALVVTVKTFSNGALDCYFTEKLRRPFEIPSETRSCNIICLFHHTWHCPKMGKDIILQLLERTIVTFKLQLCCHDSSCLMAFCQLGKLAVASVSVLFFFKAKETFEELNQMWAKTPKNSCNGISNFSSLSLIHLPVTFECLQC